MSKGVGSGRGSGQAPRRFLWRGAFADPAFRRFLAAPWHRSATTLRAIARRLRQPAVAGSPPLLSTTLAICIVTLLLGALALLPLDERISRSMLNEPGGVLDFLRLATDVGLLRWYVYPTAALLALLSTIDWSTSSRIERVVIANVYGHTAYLAAAVAGAGVVTQIGKRLFGRARPELVDIDGSLAFTTFRLSREFASFPSGHATTMGAVTIVLCVWFPPLRAPLVAAGIAFALTRVAVREHYPSDVVAGFAIGATVAILMARHLARRGLLYSLDARGAGWRGLLPVRSDRTRDLDRLARAGLKPAALRARQNLVRGRFADPRDPPTRSGGG